MSTTRNLATSSSPRSRRTSRWRSTPQTCRSKFVHNPQTGFEDLLVGDSFGDVLHLQGKGDGTFQIAGRRTTLAAQQLSNGQTDVLVANQQSDRITIQADRPSSP